MLAVGLNQEVSNSAFSLSLMEEAKRFRQLAGVTRLKVQSAYIGVAKEWIEALELELRDRRTQTLLTRSFEGRNDRYAKTSFERVGSRTASSYVHIHGQGLRIVLKDDDSVLFRRPRDDTSIDILNQSFIQRLDPNYTEDAQITVDAGSDEYWRLGTMLVTFPATDVLE